MAVLGHNGGMIMAASVFRKCLLAAGMLAAAFAFWMALLLGSAGAQQAPALKGCFVELSASGELLHDDRKAAGGLGAGCDGILNNLIVLGAGGSVDLGEVKSGSITGRIGVLVNPNLVVYGTTGLVSKDLEIAKNGAWYLGAGIETTVLSDKLSAFIEGSHAVSKFGSEAFDVNDSRIKAGVRIRLQPPKGPETHKPLM